MKTKTIAFGLFLISFLIVSCSTDEQKKKENKKNDKVCESVIEKKLKQYAPFKLAPDISKLKESEKKIVSLLIDAADIVDEIFWQQAIGKKSDFLNSIKDEKERMLAEENYGPWDRFNDNLPFIISYGRKPAGANLYPKDMTKPEFERFKNPDKKSPYTILVRDENKNLKVVPYNIAYKEQSEKVAAKLKEAAQIAENPTLKNYLEKLAEAFLNNDWRSAIIAWLQLKDTNIDFVFGPIENYEDALFGYKNSYEALIFLIDHEWSKKVERYKTFIPWLQNELGLDKKYIKPIPKNEGQIYVYDLLYAAGEANAEAKTMAKQLPNEEDIIAEHGARNIQIRNIIKAKFENILLPVAKAMLDSSLHSKITFNSFFNMILFQKLSNLMGIKENMNDRKDMRESLRDKYSVLEEAKADLLCIYMIAKLQQKGEIKESDVIETYATYIANIFRTIRFGSSNIHGRASMVVFNSMLEYGAILRNPKTGTYVIDEQKFTQAATILLKKILAMQGNRDYLGVVKLINQKGHLKIELSNDLEKLAKTSTPIDIKLIQGKKVLGI